MILSPGEALQAAHSALQTLNNECPDGRKCVESRTSQSIGYILNQLTGVIALPKEWAEWLIERIDWNVENLQDDLSDMQGRAELGQSWRTDIGNLVLLPRLIEDLQQLRQQVTEQL